MTAFFFAIFIVTGGGLAVAQKGGKPTGGDNGPPAHDPVARNSPTVNLGTLGDPEKMRREIEQAQKDALVDRQHRILKDADRLLKLTAELKAGVEATTTEQYSAADLRKLDDIERVAHDLKKRALK
ncbi:MAG: hypothetical protein ABI147_07255 [Acidobacteriaceae bacterium]